VDALKNKEKNINTYASPVAARDPL